MVDALVKWCRKPANLISFALVMISAAVIISVSVTSDNAWHAPDTRTCGER